MGCCGIDCNKCECFVATKDNDDFLRDKIAKEWSELNNYPMTREMMNCTGCKSEGIKFGFCNMCKVRKCSLEKGLDCKDCKEYKCDLLISYFGDK